VAAKMALPTAGARPRCGFARASRRQILAVDEHDFNPRHVTEPGKTVLCKARIENAAVGKENSLEEGAANGLHDGARNLVAQAVGIDHRARLPGLNDTADVTFLPAESISTSAQAAT